MQQLTSSGGNLLYEGCGGGFPMTRTMSPCEMWQQWESTTTQRDGSLSLGDTRSVYCSRCEEITPTTDRSLSEALDIEIPPDKNAHLRKFAAASRNHVSQRFRWNLYKVFLSHSLLTRYRLFKTFKEAGFPELSSSKHWKKTLTVYFTSALKQLLSLFQNFEIRRQRRQKVCNEPKRLPVHIWLIMFNVSKFLRARAVLGKILFKSI